MRKCKITIYDYENKLGENKPGEAKAYKVDAWCVQGKTGFRALFPHGRLIVEATGDDGHWWVTNAFDKHWMEEVTAMNQSMLTELMIRNSQK